MGVLQSLYEQAGQAIGAEQLQLLLVQSGAAGSAGGLGSVP